jgi:type IV pilus assembly protein PilZ
MSTRTGHKRKAAVTESARRRHERRAVPRVPVDLEVDYGCDDTFLFAYIADISILGIFVRTNRPAPPGTRLTLRFNPPGTSPLLVKGEVIWINPFRPAEENPNPGMGIRFVSLSARQRDAIGHLVRTFAYLDDDHLPHGQA